MGPFASMTEEEEAAAQADPHRYERFFGPLADVAQFLKGAVKAPFDFAGEAVDAGGFSGLDPHRVGQMGRDVGLGTLMPAASLATRQLPKGAGVVLSAGGARDGSYAAGGGATPFVEDVAKKDVNTFSIPKKQMTVKDPYRSLFPGIYGNPKEIAAEAASRVAPESPNLKAVFGVTRNDLADINQHGKRQGNIDPSSYLKEAPNPRGSAAAEGVMTRKNEQRLRDTLEEAGKHDSLRVGMDNWYTMDPAFQRLAELVGPEEAAKRWSHLNTMMGMASPGSEVLTEIGRGTLAHHLDMRGRFGDFVSHGGNKGKLSELGVSGVDGHPYHKTSQALPMQQYIDAGRQMQLASPKVPSYVHASGTPETGFQTSAAVPDAHWSRFVGLGDTRKGPTDIGASASMNEMQQLRGWWKDKIADPMGLEAVPAQARLWGAGSGQTGVTTAIGSPKLEMFADRIAKAAAREGVPLDVARDRVLMGETWAGARAPAPVSPFGERDEDRRRREGRS